MTMRKLLPLLCALLIVIPFPARAASPAIIGTPVTGNGTNAGSGVSYTIATSGDDLLVILVGQDNTSFSLSSIATSAGTLLADVPFSVADIGGLYMGIGVYRVHGALAQAYIVTPTFSRPVLWAEGLAEANGITALDGTPPALATGSGTSLASNSLTTAQNGDFVVGAMSSYSGCSLTLTWGGSFSQFVENNGNTGNAYLFGAGYTQPSAGAISASATQSSSHQWIAGIAAYTGITGACTHAGQAKNGSTSVPNGTSGSYWGKSGNWVTPDCSTVYYWSPAAGNFVVN